MINPETVRLVLLCPLRVTFSYVQRAQKVMLIRELIKKTSAIQK